DGIAKALLVMQEDGLVGEVLASPQRLRQLAQRRLARLPAPLVLAPAIGKIPQKELRDPEIEMGAPEIGPIGDRPPKMLDRVREAPLGPANQAEIIVSFGHIGVKGEGAAKALRRLVEMPLCKLYDSELADHGGIVGF